MTRKFLLGEASSAPSIYTYLQSLREALDGMRPRSATDGRRLEIAQEHLREVKRHTRKLQERVSLLEEQVKVLEEGKE